MSPDLAALLDRAQGESILVLGDVMLDRYWWGTVERTSPEAPVPVVRKTRASRAAGGAANVATNIAALGGQALLVGLVGDDDAGRELRASLAEHARVAEHLVTSPARPTTVKTRIIAHNQHVVRVDEEEPAPASAAEAAALLARVHALLDRCAVVVCSDYAKGLLTPAVLGEVVAAARAKGRPVLVDPKGLEYRRYAGATLLAPNLAEAAAASGFGRDEPGVARRAGETLLARIDVSAVVVTQGAAGMMLFERGRPPVEIPARARVVYDVTGAGDSVMAALALALAVRADLVDAAKLANAAGGLAVERVATTVVQRDDLMRVLKDDAG